MRSSLCTRTVHVPTDEACLAWCSAVNNVASLDSHLLGTSVVRDALAALCPQTTTPAACHSWCRAICSLAACAANQQLLGTAAVRDALVALSSQVTCTTWCGVIFVLTDKNVANQRLFGTAEVRDALLALRARVRSVIMCECWCRAIAQLAVPGANRMLFRESAVRDAHATLHDLAASDADSSRWWAVARAVLG
jgi:hypothetical protein